MGYSIFLSYSSKDLNTARFLEQYLIKINGVDVFLAESNLIIGELSNALMNKIKNCDMFIVLISKNSQDSAYVQQEIGVAKGAAKTIIPLVLDNEARPEAMLQGISYFPIYNESKRNEQLSRIYGHITKKAQERSMESALAIAAIGVALVLIFQNK